MSDLVLRQTESVLAYEPHSDIRQLIGHEAVLKEIFTEEKIQACAKLISTARDSFFEVTLTELNMLERLAMAPVVEESEGANFIVGIIAHANNIRGQADMLGFILVTRICAQMAVTCLALHQGQDAKRFLIGKMVEILRLAYKQKITDDGGAIGKEIMAQIDRVIGERR
jgi:hypothetical protein